MPVSWLSVAVLAAFAIAFVLTRYFTRPTSFFFVLDHPNERSLHDRPTPRTGGLAIVAGIAVGATVVVLGSGAAFSTFGGIAAGMLLVGIASFADDRMGLPPWVRLVVHLAAAALLIYSGFEMAALIVPGREWKLPGSLTIGLSMLFIVWMTNLYNFMDGMDGFAAGMAVIGFATFALLGWMAGASLFAALNFAIAAAAGGFLAFNFPPARIFMGDSGSSTLGFLAGAMSLWAQRDGLFPVWIGVLIFSPFVVDACATLARRLAHREKIWQAHKTHYYQRLVQLGWGHRRTVLWEYLLMSVCAATALWTRGQSALIQSAVLAVWAGLYGLLALRVSMLERRANSV